MHIRPTYISVLALSWVISSCEVTNEVELPATKIKNALYYAEVDLPENLGDTYLFKDGQPTNPQFGVLDYQVNASLWTDGATKQRYVFIPPKSKVSYAAASGSFDFPEGTVFAKHFTSESGHPVETRVIVKKSDASWSFGTYVWDSGTTKLNTAPRTITDPAGTDYRIPSENECKLCHNQTGKNHPVLGFSPPQLNDLTNEQLTTQLESLGEQSLFQSDIKTISETTSIDNPNDTSLSLEKRARAYLAVNCSACHRPEGAAKEKNLDFRLQISTSATNLISEKKVVPGKPEESVLWQKFSADTDRMPPLSIRHDPTGLKLIKEWIEQWPTN